jgi:alkylation response protein AidB-like acyl-CoA dehydrogenase
LVATEIQKILVAHRAMGTTSTKGVSMASDFFNPDMELFVDHRVDWKRYFHYRSPDPVDVAAEVETYKMILRTLGEVCRDIEAGSREHWHEEAELRDGKVVAPQHITEGYRKLAESGLVCLTLKPKYGGQGLPVLLNAAYLEMIARADASLMTIVGLQTGVARDIQRYGTDEIRERYLPRFATGELQGAMDLTEPQAGSDLGAIRTRATLEGDRWIVEGEKIFITNGGAPIHLVLARDHETFEQSKDTTNGLSLILCPVTLPDGRQNGIRVLRTERKLGIHGSPTCVVEFDRAEGFLLGTRGQGFRAMLDLMNEARLGVAAQGIGIAEAAYQQARGYAAERVQFGAPILHQPPVKAMLAIMLASLKAARALLYRTCAMMDLTEALHLYLETDRGAKDPDQASLREEAERNTQLIRFLTPLCKYFATEISNQVTRAGIQIHGGIGYMSETPAGHYHSDSIITTIYEGTSEIQASFALKEMSKGALFAILAQLRGELEGLKSTYPELVARVAEGIDWINQSLPALMGDPRYALLHAKRLCDMVIDVVVSVEFLQQASLSAEENHLAKAFIERQMLVVEMDAKRISSGDATLLQNIDKILGITSS